MKLNVIHEKKILLHMNNLKVQISAWVKKSKAFSYQLYISFWLKLIILVSNRSICYLLYCDSDVQHHMDMWCSGLQSCHIDVNDFVKILNPCANDLRSYLQARFTCIPGKCMPKLGYHVAL